jgi:hypothetical protein
MTLFSTSSSTSKTITSLPTRQSTRQKNKLT